MTTWPLRLALGAACLLASGSLPQGQAQPSASPPAASTSPVAEVSALVPDLADIRASTLVGPSAQLYQPAATTPASWQRLAPGGVAAQVRGAARLGEALVVAGAQTPLFAQRDGQWAVAPVGQRGRVLFGTGPAFSVAVGRHIFTLVGGKLARVGAVTETVLAVWCADERTQYVATAKGVWRRRGGAFALVPQTSGVLGFSGSAPYAITASAAIDLRSSRRLALPGTVVLVAASPRAPAAVVTLAGGQRAFVRDLTAPAPRPLELPAADSPSAAAVDGEGRALVLIAQRAYLLEADAWRPAELVERLPPPKVGPAPAKSG